MKLIKDLETRRYLDYIGSEIDIVYIGGQWSSINIPDILFYNNGGACLNSSDVDDDLASLVGLVAQLPKKPVSELREPLKPTVRVDVESLETAYHIIGSIIEDYYVEREQQEERWI